MDESTAAEGETLSLAAAARELGLGRSQVYNWASLGKLRTTKDTRTGRKRVQRSEIARLLDDPPEGTHARRRSSMSPDVRAVTVLQGRVEQLSEQVSRLTDAVAGVGTPADAGRRDELVEVRRRFHGARDSIAELAAVGALYEQAMAQEAAARVLEREASARRDNAQDALRRLLASYRAALSAATGADDVNDLAGSDSVVADRSGSDRSTRGR